MLTDLRINEEVAERVIARVLREKMNPEDAYELASKIYNGLRASREVPTHKPVKGWRLISEELSKSMSRQFLADLQVFMEDIDRRSAAAIWHTVFEYGRSVPNTVIV